MLTQVSSFILTLLIGASALAGVPRWLEKDLKAKAPWIPARVRAVGLQTTANERFAALTPEAQRTVERLHIPQWMIAFIPDAPEAQKEINDHLRDINSVRGMSPHSELAQRSEELLLFAGAAHLPTPGDNRTGRSLGAEGCTAALTKYILSQLSLEFPDQLVWFSERESRIQSSSELLKFLALVSEAPGSPIEIVRKPFHMLTSNDVQPGSFMIAQKPGGAHSLGWTRIPESWQWADSSKMAVANTGLPQFGQRMILAQEYIEQETGALHNEHGPINSNRVAKRKGLPDLTSPQTNPYAVRGTNFVMIRFR